LMSGTHRELGIVVGVEWAARDAEIRNVPFSVTHVVAPIVVDTPVAVPPDYSQRQEEAAQTIIEQAHRVAVAAAPSHEGEINTEILHAQPMPAMAELSRRAPMLAAGCRG
jgi:nucleotide-binding universal stress UspA family protein